MPMKGKEKALDSLRNRMNLMCQSLLIDGTKRVMERNPVDTGRSRANWEVQVGQPMRTADYDRRSADIAAQFQKNLTKSEGFKAGGKAFLTNGIHYVHYLEVGHSKRAPQGMVAVTLAELRPMAKRLAAQIARQPIVKTGRGRS